MRKTTLALVITLISLIFISGCGTAEENIEETTEEVAKEEITGEVIEKVEEQLKQEQEIVEIVEVIEEAEEQNLFKVTRIIDGDTIEINTGERVRLICIDTPERGKKGYQEATDFLKDLILNEEVELVKDISETDRYDRLLRYIYLEDGTFVNELIVLEGYGKAYPYKPDITLCPQIKEAESEAKSQNKGIWSEIEETTSSTTEYICSSNYYNCDDFNTHAEAQAVFEACGGVNNDIHRLDRDKDGLACESLG